MGRPVPRPHGAAARAGLRIGTRASALARAQAGQVAEMLGGGELVPVTTTGDRAGGGDLDKSRWVIELEQALREGTIDIAVHSAKDVPTEPSDGLALLGSPARAAAADAVCGAAGLDALPAGARVGTSSLRRRAQLRAARDDLDVVALRGNVDTRLRKLDAGDAGVSAIVLAQAGLQRLGLQARAEAQLDPERFVPAPGQGTLAIQGREDDERARDAVARISDPLTFACLGAERALARGLQASCDTPLGCWATGAGDGRLILRGWLGLPDGSAWIGDVQAGDGADPEDLGREVAARMKAAGAEELLRRAEEMARAAG